MKKITCSILAWMALVLMPVCFSGCSEEKDGDWDKMKWQIVLSEKEQAISTHNYSIGQEGGALEFKCKNYSGFWIAQVALRTGTDPETYIRPHDMAGNNHRSFFNEWVNVSIVGNKLTVKLQPNDGEKRTVVLTVTAGDIFDEFHFSQEAARKD